MDRIPPVLSVMLWPISLLYGLAVYCWTLPYRIGLRRPGAPGVPVVSVGNITAGGTGKTPFAGYLARMLMGRGLRVAVLSRGYRRQAASGANVLVVSDGRKLLCQPDEAGDEPWLLATKLLGSGSEPGCIVVVGGDRLRAAGRACALGARVIVLDDGFQHRRLRRDLDIVLLDARRPFDNGLLLPAGLLREPRSALARAGAIILTRSSKDTNLEAMKRSIAAYNATAPVFPTSHAPRGLYPVASAHTGVPSPPIDPSALEGLPLLLFSGIARPRAFEESIRELGLTCNRHLAFPDHHPYRDGDLRRIAAAAACCGAIVTTEKDAARLPAGWDPGKLIYALPVEIAFADPQQQRQFEDLMVRMLAAAGVGA